MKFYIPVLILLFYTAESMANKLTPYEDNLIQVIDKERDKYLVFNAYLIWLTNYL
ncbi:MAG: hypothetical protein HC803_09520 [Saprospiraceae bacterium]|nr:hypothetical protein [Saprospiraceae bacterium]